MLNKFKLFLGLSAALFSLSAFSEEQNEEHPHPHDHGFYVVIGAGGFLPVPTGGTSLESKVSADDEIYVEFCRRDHVGDWHKDGEANAQSDHYCVGKTLEPGEPRFFPFPYKYAYLNKIKIEDFNPYAASNDNATKVSHEDFVFKMKRPNEECRVDAWVAAETEFYNDEFDGHGLMIISLGSFYHQFAGAVLCFEGIYFDELYDNQ